MWPHFIHNLTHIIDLPPSPCALLISPPPLSLASPLSLSCSPLHTTTTTAGILLLHHHFHHLLTHCDEAAGCEDEDEAGGFADLFFLSASDARKA